ncbi:hypothetical protein [Actinomadura verrucosospora]|uniref:Antibiotic biosynthesis monooxygenase n=1 Tax=Actinomadura verrucosospora TaxID=46165 RepID=A0A7D3VUT2_ACTVE|nr:hypothetical protein [Actinomadura verrucosospora]QKG23170.1 hypothetical protein ACTIVE_4811 [Actinomadura verrucosospora]
MQKIAVVQYKARPEHADENQRLIEDVMAELGRDDPGGVHYAAFRLDGDAFLHVVVNEDDRDVLPSTPAFQEFQRELPARMIPGTLTRTAATLIGAYGRTPTTTATTS